MVSLTTVVTSTITIIFSANFRWDDLLVSAPFEQVRGFKKLVKRDLDSKGAQGINTAAFGSVYVFWNQKRRLPDTRAFSHDNAQILVAPQSLSQMSGFGSSITNLGDINHDGIDGTLSLYMMLYKNLFFLSTLTSLYCGAQSTIDKPSQAAVK